MERANRIESYVRRAGVVAGIALVALVVLAFRVPDGSGTLGADVIVSISPTGELGLVEVRAIHERHGTATRRHALWRGQGGEPDRPPARRAACRGFRTARISTGCCWWRSGRATLRVPSTRAGWPACARRHVRSGSTPATRRGCASAPRFPPTCAAATPGGSRPSSSSSRASWSPTVARKILLTLLVLGALGADQRCGDVLGLLEHSDELRERLRSRHRADRRQRRGQRDAVLANAQPGATDTSCMLDHVLGLAALDGAPVRLDRRTARAVPDADDHARHRRDARSSTTAPASQRTRPTTSARARE